MTAIYKLCHAGVARDAGYIAFSPSIQDKLGDYLWGEKLSKEIDPRWKISGSAPDKLCKHLDKLDYFSGLTSVPIFSQRFVSNAGPMLNEEISFTPFQIRAGERVYDLYIGRILIFDNIINHEITKSLEKLSSLAPTIYNDSQYDFYICRDTRLKTSFVASEKFKSLCNELNLRIGFIPVEMNAAVWLSRQPEQIKRRWLSLG